MKQDTFKTKVKFYMENVDEENKQVFAFFPDMHYNKELYNTTFTSYAHIGQHSACHIDYVKECEPATHEQYQELYNELVSIGYNLIVIE